MPELKKNTDYKDKGVHVKHVNGHHEKVVRTTEKMVIIEKPENKSGEGRMNFSKIAEVIFPDEWNDSVEPEIQPDFAWNKTIQYLYGPDSPYFDNDFTMAIDPENVVDNDSMYD